MRRFDRYGGTLTVQVTGDGSRRFGTIYEISAGGAFLEVSPLPKVGGRVDIEVVLDGVRHILRAEVRYRVAGDLGPRGLEGIGVAWLDLFPGEQEVVARLLERAQQGQPLRGETPE
jgi:PilZ domain